MLSPGRWQVGLLVQRWQGRDRVAVWSGPTEVRRRVRVWSRLSAALVQHVLLLGSAWGDAAKRLVKGCEAIRPFVGRPAEQRDRPAALGRVRGGRCQVVAKTCRRDRRSKPGAFELLNDVSLLDYRLT